MLVCVLLYFLHSIVQAQSWLECSSYSACPGDVISCQCRGYPQITTELYWRIFHDTIPVYEFGASDMATRIMGNYTIIVNSVSPLSSQLNITLSQPPEVTISCDIGPDIYSITLRLVVTGKATCSYKILSTMYIMQSPLDLH